MLIVGYARTASPANRWAIRCRVQVIMKINKIIPVLLVAFFMASCAPAAKVIPTATAASKSTYPTAPLPPTFTPVPPTPTLTSTPIPTVDLKSQNIPDPRLSDPDLFNLEKPNAPIPQYVHALNMAGVDISAQKINASLTYKAVKTQNGDMVILLTTTDLPETSYNEGNVPLFVYMKDQETGQYTWSKAHLKDIASLHNILVGALINAAQEMDLNKKTGMFTDNFSVANIPYDTKDVPPNSMDRDTNYRLSRIANEKLDELMFFHLGWGASQHEVFPSKEEGVKFVNDAIDSIAQKYGDKITIASIMNEIHPGYPGYSMWKMFGDEYLLDIYRHAREVLPNAKLIYNETYNYSKSHEGTYYPYTLQISKLLAKDNLIDAVGMQMHMAQNEPSLNTPINVDETVDVMRSFGLPVYVTELDVNQTYMKGSDQGKLIQQSDWYEKVVRSCVRSEVCKLINFWGQSDPWSWYIAVNEPNAKACIFDEIGAPKLAFYAVLRGLTDGYISPMP